MFSFEFLYMCQPMDGVMKCAYLIMNLAPAQMLILCKRR